MATIPWLADVLRAAGVPVVEQGDWRNRMRSGSFQPIGVLWHHTAARSSAGNPHPALNIVINGRSDLPGPLAHALVDYNGVFHVISAGRCNHAGEARASGPVPAGDGNAMLIGWEIDYDGVDQEMTAAQYDNSVKATAAVLKHLGRNHTFVRGHRETSVTGKIDPSFINLDAMRADVAEAMGGQPPPAALGVGGTPVVFNGSLQYYAGANTSGTPLYQRAYTSGRWQDWANLGGGIVGRPAVVKFGDSLQVFARGPNSRLYQRAYVSGSGWQGWVDLGGAIASDPVAVADGTALHVFARGTNSALYRRTYNTGGGWQAWNNFGGAITGTPAVVKYGDSLQVYGRGTNGVLYQKAYVDGGWREWVAQGGALSSDPTALAVGTTLHILIRGTNSGLYLKTYTPAGWQDWDNLGGEITGRPVAVQYSDSLQVYARGGNGALYQRAYQGGRWLNWVSLGGELASDPTVLVDGTALHVFIRGTNGGLYLKTYTPAGWQPWDNLGGNIR